MKMDDMKERKAFMPLPAGTVIPDEPPTPVAWMMIDSHIISGTLAPFLDQANFRGIKHQEDAFDTETGVFGLAVTPAMMIALRTLHELFRAFNGPMTVVQNDGIPKPMPGNSNSVEL
jgi:hypothetical protein